MKFRVTRTHWESYKENKEPKPCDEAYEGEYVVVDVRNVDCPSKLSIYRSGDPERWYGTGYNHRVENGKIIKDLGVKKCWFIDFDSLEELIAFQNKYNEDLVILKEETATGYKTIEIYNGYRE